jgi:hypothetical protein
MRELYPPVTGGVFLQVFALLFQLIANEGVEALHELNAQGSFCLNNLGHRFHDETCGDLLQILWRELVDFIEVDSNLAEEGLDDLVFG